MIAISIRVSARSATPIELARSAQVLGNAVGYDVIRAHRGLNWAWIKYPLRGTQEGSVLFPASLVRLPESGTANRAYSKLPLAAGRLFPIPHRSGVLKGILCW